MATNENTTVTGTGNQVVGKVFILYGTVKALAPDGTVRALAPNSQIFAHDQIITESDGSISIQFDGPPVTQLDLGRMSNVTIDEDVYAGVAPEVVAESAAEAEQIQQALLSGDDIDLEATAAGGGTGGGGAHETFNLTLTGDEGAVTSGAGTTGPSGLGAGIAGPMQGVGAPNMPTVSLSNDAGTSGTDLITNDGTLTISPAADGVDRTYTVDGGTPSSTYTAPTGDGQHTVVVTDTDTAGNTASNTITFTLDTTPPSATIILAPITADNTINIAEASGSVTVNGTVGGEVHVGDTVTLTVNGHVYTGLVQTGNIFNINVAGSDLAADSGHTITASVTTTDAAGNSTTVTANEIYGVDTTVAAPTVALTTDSGLADGITNVGTLNITGTETGALVEYSTDGGTTWTTTFTAVEGLNNVEVRETDVAGNVSAPTSLSFTLDTQVAAPTVALTTDSGLADGITNVGTLNITGTETGALVEYSTDGGTTWTTTFTTVEGVNNVEVRETDIAGNVSAPTTLSFTLDTQVAAPTVALTTDSGLADGITNVGTLNITGTETGALVEYSTDGGTTWTTTFTAVEGVNNVEVRETDIAGNVSAPTTLSFTLDTQVAAPTVALTTDSGLADGITNVGTLNITGTETGALVEYSTDGGTTWTTTFTAVEGVNNVEVRETDIAGNVSAPTSLSFTLDTQVAAPTVALTTDSGLADGITNVGTLNITGTETGALIEYSTNGGTTWTTTFTAAEGANTVLVRETDIAGNVSAPTSLNFTLDTQVAAPTVALTTDSGLADGITNVGTLNITGTETGALIEYSTNGGTTWTTTFTAAEGANTVLVRETDIAGNVSAPTSLNFTLDTQVAAPTVALTTDSGLADGITNVGTLNITGTETGALIEYSTNGGTTWTTTFTAAEGANTVLVRETDIAGNVSAPTTLSFTLDTQVAAPTVALTTDSGLADGITNVGTLNITGTETGALIEYSTDGGTTWTTTFTAVEGVNNVEVRETDIAGNVSAPTSLSFTLDTQVAAPTVALTTDSGLADGITNVGTLNITGTETGALVEYSTDGGAHWTTTFTAVEGVNNVEVRETDVAGNVSAPTSLSFTLDTTPPSATIAVNAITVDNTVNFSESQGNVVITGTVGGDAHAGDTVTLTVNDHAYTGTVLVGNTYSINVAGTDLAAGSNVHATVTTTDLAGNSSTATADHEYGVDISNPVVGPTDSNSTANTVAEDATVGTVVNLTAHATDADAGATISYSLTDNAGGHFAIDSTTGVVTVASALDYETATSHSVTVLATSSDGSFNSNTFTIAVTNVNDNPVVGPTDSNSNLAVNTVAENAAVGTEVALTAHATDADAGATISYSLTDNAGGHFAIDSTTGVVTVASALDYETATSHNVTVLATSSDGSFNSNTFTIAVTNVDESGNPVVGPTDSNSTANTVAEDATVGTVVNLTAYATDADAGTTISYSLTDNAGGHFAIDSTTGVVTVASALDYETATSHNVTVLATSSDGSFNSNTFTIAVTNVNDNPVVGPTDSNLAVNTVAENAAVGTEVALTAHATDADAGATISYSLTDNASGHFAIDSTTGVVTVASALDYETATSHNVTVLATSSDGSFNSNTFTIAVTNVDESGNPVVGPTDSNSTANTVAEDATVGTVVNLTAYATDADAGTTISYSLTDNAGGHFAIDSTTGVVTVASALDYETATSHSVTVLATSSDGSFNSNTFTIAVTNVNDNPVVGPTDSNLAVNTVAENAAVGTEVALTAHATDADAGATISYSLTDNAGGHFAIDSTTGVVTVASALDYETATSHNVTVLATSSDGSFNSNTFTIAVTNVNDNPVVGPTDSNLAVNTVAENAAVGTEVALTAHATDADAGATISYSLTDNASGHFAIDSTTGVVTVASALDYETATSHNVTVLATSSDGSFNSNTFTIAVTNVDESGNPVVGPTDSNSTANTVAEDATVGTVVNLTAHATDADAGATISYSLTDNAGGHFAIDSTTGVVTVASALDYETATSHSVTVLATSSDGSFNSNTFTIAVTNVNDNPVVGPTDSNSNLAVNTVAENAAVGTEVALTAHATDADAGATISYSLTDNAGGHFAIDSTTGVVTVASALDYETATSHSVTVLATSSDGSFNSNTFTIEVTNVNDNPVVGPTDSNLAVNTVAENAAVGTEVALTAHATDADAGATISYSLTDNAGGHFAIDSTTGVVTVASALDYETATSHSVTVLATSSDGSFNSNTFTIAVTNVDDNPVVGPTDSNLAVNTVAENAAVGTEVALTAHATDADAGATISYSLTDNAGGHFAIDSTTGVVTVASALDYETATSHSVTVLATSSDGSFNSNTFTIAVTNVDESGNPVVGPTDSNSTANTVAEDATVGTVVNLTAHATDADAGATISYSLTDNAGGHFAIDSTTGVVTVASALDYETATSHSVTVLATSSDGSFNSNTFTIAVTNVDDVTGRLIVGSELSDTGGSPAPWTVGGGSGQIQGDSGNDILIGDPGAHQVVNPGDHANIVLVLDSSASMTNPISFTDSDGHIHTMTRMEALKASTNQLLSDLHNSDADKVTVTIVDFDTNAKNLGTGTFTFVLKGGADDAAALQAAHDAVNAGTFAAGGGTNYEAGLSLAYKWITGTQPDSEANVNKVLFVSDGNPTNYLNNNGTVGGTGLETAKNVATSQAQVLGSDGSNEVTAITDHFTTVDGVEHHYTIEAVGINITSADSIARLDAIDTGDHHAQIIQTADDLTLSTGTLVGTTTTHVYGSDTIHGGDGNDILFGDSVNTDMLLASHPELNLNPGSGWQVFDALQHAQPDIWTDGHIKDYIINNQTDLANESAGQTGGNDIINGGAGSDIIYGQGGNDTVDGGTGNNTLTGGTSNDTFKVGQGHDHITDYHQIPGSEHDVVDISHVLNTTDNTRLGVIDDAGKAELVIYDNAAHSNIIGSVTFDNINFHDLGSDPLNSLLSQVDLHHTV